MEYKKKELIQILYDKRIYNKSYERLPKKEIYNIINNHNISKISTSPKKNNIIYDTCLKTRKIELIVLLKNNGFKYKMLENMNKKSLCNLKNIGKLTKEKLNIIKKYSFELSEIYCSNILNLKIEEKSNYCNMFTNHLVKIMLKYMSENLFDKPERCLAELISNSIISYNNTISTKYGIGFISLLYWIFYHYNKKIYIITKNNNGYWYATLSINHKEDIILDLNILKNNHKVKNGTIIALLDDKEYKLTSKDIKKELRAKFYNIDNHYEYKDEFNKYIKLFEFVDGYKIIVNDKIIKNGDKEIYILLKNDNIYIEDYGKGIDLNILFEKLLIPKISNIKIETETKFLFKINKFQNSSLIIGYNNVGIYIYEHYDGNYQYFYNMNCFYNKNGIFFKDENEILDLIDKTLETIYIYNNFDIVNILLNHLINDCKQNNIKKLIRSKIYEFKEKNIFVPMKSECYPDNIILLVSKDYSVYKLNKLLKTNNYNENIFLNNIVYITRGIETFSREGTNNIIFVRDSYILKYPNWINLISNNMSNEKLIRYNDNKILLSTNIKNLLKTTNNKNQKDKIKQYTQEIDQLIGIIEKKYESFIFYKNNQINLSEVKEFIYSNILYFIYNDNDVKYFICDYIIFISSLYVEIDKIIYIDDYENTLIDQNIDWLFFIEMSKLKFKTRKTLLSLKKFYLYTQIPKHIFDYYEIVDIIINDNYFLIDDYQFKKYNIIKNFPKFDKSIIINASEILYQISNNELYNQNYEWNNNSNFIQNILEIILNINPNNKIENIINILIYLCYYENIEIELNDFKLNIKSDKEYDNILNLLIPYLDDKNIFALYDTNLISTVYIKCLNYLIIAKPIKNDVNFNIIKTNDKNMEIIIKFHENIGKEIFIYLNRIISTLPINIKLNSNHISVKRILITNIYLNDILLANIYTCKNKKIISNIQIENSIHSKLSDHLDQFTENIIIEFIYTIDLKKDKLLLIEVINKAIFYKNIYDNRFHIYGIDQSGYIDDYLPIMNSNLDCTNNINNKIISVEDIIYSIYNETDCKKNNIKTFLNKYYNLEKLVYQYIINWFSYKKIRPILEYNEYNDINKLEKILTKFTQKLWQIGNRLEREGRLKGTNFNIIPNIVLESYKCERYLGYYDYKNHKIVININKIDQNIIKNLFNEYENMSSFIHELSHAWFQNYSRHERHDHNNNLYVLEKKVEGDYFKQGSTVYNRILQENLIDEFYRSIK